MTKIGLDSDSFGVPASDDHRADVCGPGAGYSRPLVMARKFIGETTPKIVRLSDVYRLPQQGYLSTKNVDSGNGVEDDVSERKVLEFVRPAAVPTPN